MKQTVLLFAAALCMAAASAQTKGKPAPKAAAPLKSLNDSASYAIGVSVASFYKQQGFTSINNALVTKAINDIMSGKKALLDDAACNNAIVTYQNRAQMQKSKGRISEGQAYLAKNKLRPEVKVTASGLQYEVITEGTGPKPGPTDSVTCHYRGTYTDGKGFDNSYDRGAPITFALNRVIPGWTEGVQLMSVGSKYKLYIPYTLGYGPSDYMSIPGGSALVFEIELLDVKKGQ
ncbi:MAG: FKBP-type peptidyl-prolyl cis-trans isomerase [Ferruginibacter sp.]